MLMRLESIAEKMDVQAKAIPGNIVDVKPALKAFDPVEVEKVIGMPGKATLIQCIKSITGNHTLWKSLSSPVAGVLDLRSLEKNVQEALEARDKARGMIATRSGLAVFKQQDGTVVDSFFKEVKKARTSVPTKLRKALDALAAQCPKDEIVDEHDDAEDADVGRGPALATCR